MQVKHANRKLFGQDGHISKGRPVGCRSKMNRLIDDVVKATFKKMQTHKTANLYNWAIENPTAFYTVVLRKVDINIIQANLYGGEGNEGLNPMTEGMRLVMTENNKAAQSKEAIEHYIDYEKIKDNESMDNDI
jgi:hypothetical protein